VKSGLIILSAAMMAVTSAGAETITVPLGRTNGWLFIKYGKVPPNTFRATSAGFEIGVTNSAAPALFPLTNGLRITDLRASGKISGSLKIPTGKQGEKGFDDYAIRVGLVEAGTRTMNWRERLVSPDWVKQLFALAPPGTGITKVHFFNIATDTTHLGRTRAHPKSDLMHETITGVPDANGNFTITNHFTKPIAALAVWISSDGDHSKSSFAVTLEKMELSVEGAPASQSAGSQ
jgi:hypothetical protein